MQPVQCKECGKTFMNKAKHYAHMINSHPKETSNCELCGWVSKTKEALKVHQVLGCQKQKKREQRRNITTGPKGGVCDICSSTVENLWNHKRSEHVTVTEDDSGDLEDVTFEENPAFSVFISCSAYMSKSEG